MTNWREALHQAYRNLCFAHASFVVLPKATALTASRYSAEFHRRNVGLCFVENSVATVVLESNVVAPLQPWLADLAAVAANKDSRAHIRV